MTDRGLSHRDIKISPPLRGRKIEIRTGSSEISKNTSKQPRDPNWIPKELQLAKRRLNSSKSPGLS
ncbi:hypothetical protein ACTXT7_008113 [Hymenolepis weldensis]